MKRKTQIVQVRPAGPSHRVVTVTGGGNQYCKTPCPQCPWRVDQTGAFPADAFRRSANTAYDLACAVFSCHMAGTDTPAICAGFILRGAAHNLSMRMRARDGRCNPAEVSDGGLTLHADYRAMAEANGVPVDDEALRLCREGVRDGQD